MICENCKTEHDGSYGSGRFCSCKCARGFSTKAKRKEINKKVGNKLKGTGHPPIKKTCKTCKKEFFINWNKRNNMYCSLKCVQQNESIREILSKKRISQIINGNVNNFGIKMNYSFKEKNIKCDSKIEYSCLNYFENLGATDMKRCDFYIEYLDKNKIRRYNPDFEIILNNKIYIVESKSFISIKNLNEKWRLYNELSILKKECLENYCKKNNYISFWYTKNLNIKFYNKIKTIVK